MEELIELYHIVTGFEASCNMTNDQIDQYHELNRKYNRLTKGHFNYSICRKKNLINQVEKYLSQNGYTFNKRSRR